MKLFIVACLFGFGYPRLLSVFLHTMTSHGVLPPCVLISMDTFLCLCGNPQLISLPGVYAMYVESPELFIEQVCRTWMVQPVRYFLTSMVNKVARCLSDVLRELLPSIKQSYCISFLTHPSSQITPPLLATRQPLQRFSKGIFRMPP